MRMADLSITIPEIEDRLRRAGITVDEFCESAGVHRATWQRWKADKHAPRLTVWRRVVAAVPEAQGETVHV